MVTESTVERTAEATGAKVGHSIEAKVPFDEDRPWDWHKDADGMTCAYVSIDLTGVRKQGPKGATSEGEMLAVGRVDNPIPIDPFRRLPGLAKVVLSDAFG